MPKAVLVNSSKAESGANTLTLRNVEIPGSAGARGVFVKNGRFNVSEPDIEDAINYVEGAIYVGKLEPSAIGNLGTEGCIGYLKEMINSDGTDILDKAQHGSEEVVRDVPVPPTADGKYYITMVVEGEGNANTKSVTMALLCQINK
jgi:hypothetical protein